MTVALTRVDNQLQIAVSDQGPGVEEAKLSSIFDPFVRVKSALSGKGYGRGWRSPARWCWRTAAG